MLCDFAMRFCHAILRCDFGVQFCHAILPCVFTVRFCCAILWCDFALQFYGAILLCDFVVQYFQPDVTVQSFRLQINHAYYYGFAESQITRKCQCHFLEMRTEQGCQISFTKSYCYKYIYCFSIMLIIKTNCPGKRA